MPGHPGIARRDDDIFMERLIALGFCRADGTGGGRHKGHGRQHAHVQQGSQLLWRLWHRGSTGAAWGRPRLCTQVPQRWQRCLRPVSPQFFTSEKWIPCDQDVPPVHWIGMYIVIHIGILPVTFDVVCLHLIYLHARLMEDISDAGTETAPRTRGRFLRHSTWRACGICPSSSSAKTTTTVGPLHIITVDSNT